MNPTPPHDRMTKAAGIGVLTLVGLAVYFPALHGDWIWDDASEVIDNTVIQGPASALVGAWIEPSQTDYFPLKTTVQWAEWHLWGADRLGWHLTSVGLHILSACLLWRVLSRLGMFQAWWGALLFLVHPLAVESVAWIAELKNTLSLPLMLLAWDAHLTACGESGSETPRAFPPARMKSLGWFTAAMLAKSSVVMFPACLVLHGLWRRGRLARRDVLATVPFFAAALALGAVTVAFQRQRAIGEGGMDIGSLGHRIGESGPRILFYLGKCAWPFHLLPMYVREPIEPLGFHAMGAWLALGFVFALLWLRFGRKGRAAIFGLGFFVLNLVPVLGIVPMAYLEYAWVADHFAYVATIGLVALAAAGSGSVLEWLRGRSVGLARVAAGLALGLVLALAESSHRQARLYRDPVAFWSAVVRENPGAWAAHYNLADALARAPGGEAEARVQCEEALRIKPGYAKGHFTLAMLLMKLPGREGDALSELEAALALNPDMVEAHNGLANLLSHLPGRQSEAESHYRTALRLQPDFAEAHSNLALLLGQEPGREEEALEHFRTAIQLKPGYADGYDNLGVLLSHLPGRQAEAEKNFETTLRLRPDYAEAHYNEALLLAAQPGRESEALAHYESALRLRPDYAEAHSNLAILLTRIPGRLGDAEAHFEAALRLKPDSADAHYNLATVLALIPGRRDDAERQFIEALALSPGHVPAKLGLERLRSGGP